MVYSQLKLIQRSSINGHKFRLRHHTSGAVTGELAGLLYGIEGIPNEGLDVLARKEAIVNLK